MKHILIQCISTKQKIVVCVLLSIVCIGMPLVAQEGTRNENVKPREDSKDLPNILDPPKKTKPEPVPYEQTEDEFSLGAYYTYRFFAITVGSFPFSILLSSVIFDTYRTIDFSIQNNSFQSKYLPLFFGGADKPVYTSDEVVSVLFIGLGVSISIALADLIISLITDNTDAAIDELFESVQ